MVKSWIKVRTLVRKIKNNTRLDEERKREVNTSTGKRKGQTIVQTGTAMTIDKQSKEKVLWER